MDLFPIEPWQLAILVPAFVLVSAVYASVGLGGATGYLAVMALIAVPYQFMPSTALLLNLIVTGAALARYGLAGRVRWRLAVPFLVPAVPAAFLGGFFEVPGQVFDAVLGVSLLVVGITMMMTAVSGRRVEPSAIALWTIGPLSGAVVGFVSGVIGIGGGVFLGPIVMLLGWAGPKTVATMNSMVILLVSASALAAHGFKGAISLELAAPLAVAVLLGGLVGSHIGETRLSAAVLKRLFASIVLVAGAKSVLVVVW